MDTVGNKAARAEIAMIKVVAPNMALRVLDRAIQAHGAAGVSQDTFLAHAWASSRTLRLADGPDEVHLETIAKLELKKDGNGRRKPELRVSPGDRPRAVGDQARRRAALQRIRRRRIPLQSARIDALQDAREPEHRERQVEIPIREARATRAPAVGGDIRRLRPASRGDRYRTASTRPSASGGR